MIFLICWTQTRSNNSLPFVVTNHIFGDVGELVTPVGNSASWRWWEFNYIMKIIVNAKLSEKHRCSSKTGIPSKERKYHLVRCACNWLLSTLIRVCVHLNLSHLIHDIVIKLPEIKLISKKILKTKMIYRTLDKKRFVKIRKIYGYSFRLGNTIEQQLVLISDQNGPHQSSPLFCYVITLIWW